jgi:hypothetical protein
LNAIETVLEMKNMRRREFLVGFGYAGALSAVVPTLAKAQTIPCAPPDLSIDGGGSVATPCRPTSLTELASDLAPGQSTASLGDTGLTTEALYGIQWANRFHVDVAHGRAHLLGKNASSQGSERMNCLYDLASNTWKYAIYGGDELGHVYESMAFDQARSEMYVGKWSGADTLRKWSYNNPLNSWNEQATSPYGAPINIDTQPALCWHPNLFGPDDGGVLALKHEGADTVFVIAWRRSNNSWYTVPGTHTTGLSGSYRSNGAIEYVAGGDFCIAAYNPARGGRTFRIDRGAGGSLATAVRVSDVPMHCGYTGANGNVGILIDDPAGSPSPYILEKGGSNRVWRYNNGNWALRSYQHPFPAGTSSTDDKWVVATCRSLGVFWSKHQSPKTPSRLWRPNA